jgi:hypothetical protein
LSKVILMEIVYYYKVKETHFYICDNDQDDQPEFYETLYNLKDQGYNAFQIFKGFENSYEGLTAFRKCFRQWDKEINTVNKVIKYSERKSNFGAVYQIYFKYCEYEAFKVKRDMKKNRKIDAFQQVIDYDEFICLESTFNGGKQYLMDSIRNVSTQMYSYDFSSFYPSIMGMQSSLFEIPVTQGRKLNLKKINWENPKYGTYHVRIYSTNYESAKKIFAFNPRNWYSHYCIKFAYKYRKELGFTFELLNPEENEDYNAYIYDNVIPSSSIFGYWYKQLLKIKQKFPKNKLVKHLLSSLHGTLVAGNYIYMKEDEIDVDADILDIKDREYSEYKLKEEIDNGSTLFKLVRSNNPYRGPFARMKPYIVSFARNYVAIFVMKNGLIDNLLRVHTDGMQFDKEIDFSHIEYAPIFEEDKSGKYIYEHIGKKTKV